MVAEYVKAGYKKIHLDTSFPLGGEKKIDPETVAKRQAELCRVAEEVARDSKDKPIYVLGTEVPFAGGTVNEEDFVTNPEDFLNEYEITKEIFLKEELGDAWNRVIAFVVQPGVEFHRESIRIYSRERAKALSESLKNLDIVFEAHSTDYQPTKRLKEMVEDGFKILKVGPEFTFKFREAVFLLDKMENEIVEKPSNVEKIVFEKMKEEPKYWKDYYDDEIWMKYSFLDRIRYYWDFDEVREALEKLIDNLKSVDIPLPMISQYFEEQFWKILNGKLSKDPVELILDRIGSSIRRYIEVVS
jgi:D-tagatose-1,6-bisphosphate aldolase subunit GatZ/KbaZ